MTSGIWRLSVPGGLPPESCTQLAALLSAIAGAEAAPDEVPFISPLMALRDAGGDSIGLDLMAGGKERPGHILIHESLALEAHRSLAAGQSFTVDARVDDSGAGSNGVAMTASLSTAANTGAVTVMARLRWVGASALARLKPLELSRAAKGEDLRRFETRPVRQGEVTRYVTLAGDANPLHVDEQCAIRAGLETTVIPGALLTGLLEPALAAMSAGYRIRALRVRFVSPHPMGESIGFAISEKALGSAMHAADLRVFIYRRGEGVTGVADVILAG